jgi:predicted lipoprotein with Yx(FWY)xxD motif
MKSLLSALALSLTMFHAAAVMADDAGKFAPLTELELADGRDVVADTAGRVAYTFDVDGDNVSNCYDSCAKAWPPILVKSAGELNAPMGVTTRKDGSLQLTLQGHPLYYYIGDKNPGDIKGDGLGKVWHIIVD